MPDLADHLGTLRGSRSTTSVARREARFKEDGADGGVFRRHRVRLFFADDTADILLLV